MKKIFKIFGIFMCAPFLSSAQINNQTRDVRVMESEVQNQQKFIAGLNAQRLGKLENAAKLFQDNSLDFVYIDSAHDYEHTKEDLETWYPKVKKGGLFCGDDSAAGHFGR